MRDFWRSPTARKPVANIPGPVPDGRARPSASIRRPTFDTHARLS
jgi:hypothetical protein